MRDPKRRFSTRVENYVRFRPAYPQGVIEVLSDRGLLSPPLSPEDVVADVGSGTGILSRLFLDHGNRVLAVEPNAQMRAAAEAALEHHSDFVSSNGTAEQTTLADRSADLVAAGQAFHWFDAGLARREFARILRPAGRVVLLWNTRDTAASPFMAAYERMLQAHGTDYREVDHRRIDTGRIRAFFEPGAFRRVTLPNRQTLDLEGLRGRLLSSSYVPEPGQAGCAEMLAALERLFTAHETRGSVDLEYETEMYLGRLDPGSC